MVDGITTKYLTDIKKKIIITNSKLTNEGEKIGTSIIYNLTSFKEFKNEITLKTQLTYNNKISTKVPSNISLNDIVYSDKIILSAKINNAADIENISLISQHNILKNIEYYYKNNNLVNPNPRIIFKKSYVNNMSNNNKLLNIANNDNIMRFNILNEEFNIPIYNLPSRISHYKIKNNINIILNYYDNFKNSNYYNINLVDFYLKKNNLINSINSIKLRDFSLNNNFNNFNNYNNYNIDDSTLSTLFCISNNSVSKLPLIIESDNSISDTSYNLLLFNIPENLTSFKLHYFNSLDNQLSRDSSNNITFIIKKFQNFTDEHYGKIYLTKDKIYLNTQVYTENKPYIETSDNSNNIFLSTNNGSTGLTIKNILKNMIFDISKQYQNNISKAYLDSKISENNINKIYISRQSIENNYNYDITNLNFLINNNYNFFYNYINYYKSLRTTLKEETINFSNTITISYETIYKSRINDLSLITNYSQNFQNSVIKLNENDGAFDILYNFRNNYGSNFDILYNFRNNYGSNFDLSNSYILEYNYNNELGNNDISYENIENMIDFSENLLLNFININLDTFISTYDVPSDFFKNVDCLFTYNKPGTTNYEYPNNNIDIIKNPPIDTLIDAIQLLPNANANTLNTSFIPFKNSSNMSRKQIYAHIANNNIPKLLSIEPYDKKILIGRGLDGQYNINDECPNEENIVLNKYNSQLHSSVKLQNTRNKNFANIMNRNRRNNLNTVNCDEKSYIRNNVTINNYKTYISRFHLKK